MMLLKMIRKMFSKTYVLYNKITQLFLWPILHREYKVPAFSQINERAIEYSFVFDCLWKICPQEVLDVGPGKSALPHLMSNCGFRVTAIDQKQSYWQTKFVNRHYWVIEDDITNPKINKEFDLITCISTLEHIHNHEEALKGMFKLLKPKGYLILTIPYNEQTYIENVYRLPGVGYGQLLPYICQVFSRKEIQKWLYLNRGEIIRQEYYEVFTGDLWAFGQRIYHPKKVTKKEKHHLSCMLIQKNC